MIVFLTLIYIAILLLLIKLGKVPNSKGTWLTLIPYELILLIGFFIPMQWGAPAGPARLLTYSVSIVPNVAGEVTEVLARPNEPMKQGDVLFRIDPTPYRAALNGLEAQLRLAETRLSQSRELAAADAGSRFEVEAFQAQVDGLRAQIENAAWNLAETEVRAPSDGYATNIALRPGARVVTLPFAPAMAYVDTTERGVLAQIHQIHSRYIEPGQKAEVMFKTHPGRVFPATVVYVIPATVQGVQPVQGTPVTPLNQTGIQPGPFVVRLVLDDPEIMDSILPGATGEVAIYTSRVRMAHVIRKVMIRMNAIMAYVMPN